jgi:hypothetical protein
MAVAQSGLVWLCLMCLTWSATVRGSPLPATTGDKNSPNSAKSDQTIPLIELSTSSTKARHATGEYQIGPQNDHSVPKATREYQIGPQNDQSVPNDFKQSKIGTLATYTSQDSTAVTTGVLHDANPMRPKYSCTLDSQCHPPDSNYTIPSNLVRCNNVTGTCVCNDCFSLWNDTCAVKRCHRFDENSGVCEDKRESQKTLLVLSVFLSSTGAANLYIGQEGLGYAQLGLLLFTFICCCCIYCIKKCCMECCTLFSDECDCYDCCEDFWMCCRKELHFDVEIFDGHK